MNYFIIIIGGNRKFSQFSRPNWCVLSYYYYYLMCSPSIDLLPRYCPYMARQPTGWLYSTIRIYCSLCRCRFILRCNLIFILASWSYSSGSTECIDGKLLYFHSSRCSPPLHTIDANIVFVYFLVDYVIASEYRIVHVSARFPNAHVSEYYWENKNGWPPFALHVNWSAWFRFAYTIGL